MGRSYSSFLHQRENTPSVVVVGLVGDHTDLGVDGMCLVDSWERLPSASDVASGA